MKRPGFSLLRFSLLLALVGVFLYSASVQEIHYLFINHHSEINEHCHNHLHAQTHHVDCNLCKIELSSYLQTSVQLDCSNNFYPSSRNFVATRDAAFNYKHPAISLRGPPQYV